MTISKIEMERREALESEDTKYCPKCRVVKPLFEFGISANGRKLAYTYCLLCEKEDKIIRTRGITLKDYDQILQEQDGCCKICKTKTPRGNGRFHVDHCHTTNKIRGLLCNNCNICLGYAKDNPEILIAAAHYLIDSRKQ